MSAAATGVPGVRTVEGTVNRDSATTAMSFTHAYGDETAVPQVREVAPIVFVVDEDISVRESLELLVICQGWQAETFESADELLARPRPQAPSCLILDISLPGRDGLEVQKRIAREHPEMPIIFTAGYEDIRTTVEAMKAGAVEFLVKPLSNDVMLGAIREGLERSRGALHRQSEMRDLESAYASLTPRERQVMALVSSGLLNKQVGGELGISEITVKGHRGQVMHKMKANSLADLVMMDAKLRHEPQRTRWV